MLVPVNLAVKDRPDSYVVLEALQEEYREVDILLNIFEIREQKIDETSTSDTPKAKYEIHFDSLATPNSNNFPPPHTITADDLCDFRLTQKLCNILHEIRERRDKNKKS